MKLQKLKIKLQLKYKQAINIPNQVCVYKQFLF